MIILKLFSLSSAKLKSAFPRCCLALIALAIVLTFSFRSVAEVEHTLLRRIAVFPIADSNSSNSEEAWWQMRENLTKDQRFFVASRRFMINRGVFQPRKLLKPADVIILSKILDAQALVITYLQERSLKMKVFEGENGYLIWEGTAELHPAIPINDQLIRMSSQLMNAFVVAIPYQGFQTIDETIGKAVYEEDGKQFAQVYIGSRSKVLEGDAAQWVQITGDVGQAFFSSTTKVTVIAEGKVTEIEGDYATVEIQKSKNLQDLKENSLVRFPRELSRLQDQYISGEKPSDLAPEYLSSEMKSVDEFKQNHNATSSTLVWITSIAGFILLAF